MGEASFINERPGHFESKLKHNYGRLNCSGVNMFYSGLEYHSY